MDKLNIDLNQLEDILQKYKLKKKYYRLKDGSFLDLQESNEIDFIDNLYVLIDIINERNYNRRKSLFSTKRSAAWISANWKPLCIP